MYAEGGRRRSRSIIVLFLLPSVFLYLVFFAYPSIDALRFSLYDWQGMNIAMAKFVGLRNFQEAFQDRWVQVALKNTLLITVAGGVFMFSFALLFAAALTHDTIRGRWFFRSILFFPYVLSGPGVGLFWSFILNPSFGALNGALQALGLGMWAQPWLAQRSTALGAIIFVSVWWSIGFYVLFLAAGIQTIPRELSDAARVDGANEAQLFGYLTLPLLRDFLAIAVILWVIDALKTFGVVLLLTQGGPANQTQVLTTYMMMMAFRMGGSSGGIMRLGYGTTIAVILCGLVVLASLVFFRLQRREAIEM